MIDSTARAERFETGFAASPAYTWTVPQKPVSVRIPFAIIDKMEREAVDSFRSLTSRGSEIGGLLFGSVAPGSPALVTIENYEPVACEYTGGPLYHLTATELARLDRLMEQRRVAGAIAVGFYRSHTRKGLSLDADDLALIESRFAGPHDVVLVVRPQATKASTAGIFIREDGNVNGEASCLEFPFRSSQHDATRSDVKENSTVAGPRSVAAAPAAPRPAARAQIVPIASRREIAATMPVAPVEPPVAPAVAKPEAESPAPVAAAPVEKAVAPPPQPKTEPAPKPAVAEKPEPPAPEAKASAPSKPAEPEKKEAPAPAAKKETPAPAPPPAPAAKKETPAPAPPPAPVETVEPERGRSGKMLWIGIGVAVPVLLLGGFFFSSGILHPGNRSIPTPGQDSSPLSLRIERNATDVVLTWNRDSAAIQHATKAVLSIVDGPQHENVELDPAQLRNGSIVYSPVTGDVVFKMEVTGSNQSKTTSESLRVLRTRPSPMPDEPQSVVAGAKPGAPAAPLAAPANPAAPAPTDEAEAPPEEEKVKLSSAVKPFSADSLARRLRPARPAEAAAPDVPSVVGVPKMNDVNLGGIGGNTAAPLPNNPAPVPATAPPAAVAEKKLSAGSGGQIQQAELVYRKAPEYPKLARDSGASGVVELIATIGTNGRVKAVQVVKGHPLLRQSAVDAVKQWVYKPTILNGMPVEAQTQVLLNFKSER
jgi:protein TonB